MRLDDFSYDLPESLIAQEPLADRTASRLLVVDRGGDAPPTDARFGDIARYLGEDDVVVVNRSRVVRARLMTRRQSGASIEVLFIHHSADSRIVAWVRGMAKLKAGETLLDDVSGLETLRFLEPLGDREALLEFLPSPDWHTIDEYMAAHGHVPLPPYIRRGDTAADGERYQTVFADQDGSVAAPTAGLHFDDALIDALRGRGVSVYSVVLHVGPGTFSPLEHATVEDNSLHAETYSVPAATIEGLAEARAAGRRVVAVGTTVARSLESAQSAGWLDGGSVDRGGETNLFIYPGYKFRVVDRLITNFHLPRSSLLLLVGALLGRERMLECYRLAVERRYRFYSYGDAMLIL